MKARLKSLIPSPKWRDILGLIISSVFLWATLRQTSDELWDIHLSYEQWFWVSISLLFMGAVLWVQGYRMRWFLAETPWRLEGIHGFRSVTIGSFYNALLPGNLGEAIKIQHFSLKNRIRLHTALACWLGEKFIDGVMMAMLGFLLLLIPAFRTSILKWPLLMPVTVATVCVTLLILSFRSSTILKRLFRLVPSASVATFFFRSFLEFRGRLFCRQGLFRAVGFVVLGVIIWTMNYVAFMVNMKAGGAPDQLIRPENILMLMIIMGLIYFIPSAPSSVGVMHYGIFSSLVVIADIQDVELTSGIKDSFVLISVLFHATYVIPELVLGAVHLFKERTLVFSFQRGDAQPEEM